MKIKIWNEAGFLEFGFNKLILFQNILFKGKDGGGRHAWTSLREYFFLVKKFDKEKIFS